MLNACTETTMNQSQDDSLGALADYIEELVATCQGDVRNYLRKHKLGLDWTWCGLTSSPGTVINISMTEIGVCQADRRSRVKCWIKLTTKSTKG